MRQRQGRARRELVLEGMGGREELQLPLEPGCTCLASRPACMFHGRLLTPDETDLPKRGGLPGHSCSSVFWQILLGEHLEIHRELCAGGDGLCACVHGCLRVHVPLLVGIWPGFPFGAGIKIFRPSILWPSAQLRNSSWEHHRLPSSLMRGGNRCFLNVKIKKLMGTIFEADLQSCGNLGDQPPSHG